jgi:hypothetical protein
MLTRDTYRIAAMPLSDTACRGAKPGDKPRKMFDGGGLHLLVKPTSYG